LKDQIDRRLAALGAAREAMRQAIKDLTEAASVSHLEIEEVILINRELLHNILDLFELLEDDPDDERFKILQPLEIYFLAADRLLITMLDTAEPAVA
jgi:hypothetical protein